MGDVLVKFRYDESDIATALRLQLRVAVRRRLDLALAPVAFAAACIAGYVVAPAGPARIAVVVVGLCIVVAFVIGVVLVPRIMFRRRPALRAPMSVDVHDEGITVIAGPVARTIAWADCGRIDESRRLCVIHHGDGEMLLLPRRAFRNASREAAFFDLVKRHASRDSRRFESGKSTPSANQ